MLRYRCAALTAPTLATLLALQTRVDGVHDAVAKLQMATLLFRSKRNAAWREIRTKLASVAPGGQACFYCERDRFRDIEHIRPKRHYPSECFNWNNYLYSCTICNQDRKGDKYAVIDAAGRLIE